MNMKKQIARIQNSLLVHDLMVSVKTIVTLVFITLCTFGVMYLMNFRITVSPIVTYISPVATTSATIK
jgi:hypothetical protein